VALSPYESKETSAGSSSTNNCASTGLRRFSDGHVIAYAGLKHFFDIHVGMYTGLRHFPARHVSA
jgi:hypothetical protein